MFLGGALTKKMGNNKSQASSLRRMLSRLVIFLGEERLKDF